MTSNSDNSSTPVPPSSGERPLKVIMGRPMQRPGETKEQAARRLAQQLFGKLKLDQSPPAASDDQEPHGRDLDKEA